MLKLDKCSTYLFLLKLSVLLKRFIEYHNIKQIDQVKRQM